MEFRYVEKNLRDERGLTMDELCYQLNKRYGLTIGKSIISKWERGLQYPHASHLSALADFYNVSVDYLMGRTDEPTLNMKEGAITKKEMRLLTAYRMASEDTQNAVNAVLHI